MSTTATPRGRADPCVIVIFGASGDLTQRKLIPSLYTLHARADLPEGTCIVGVSRSDIPDDAFRARMREATDEHAPGGVNDDTWRGFAKRIFYHRGDAAKPETFGPLVERINALASEHNIARAEGGPNLLFFLSVAPELYEPIVENIGAAGLVTEGKRWCALNPDELPWQRIIVEKPFGTDYRSAVSLNRALGRVFEEESIFRIDHYLGKELVQNILVMRFANSVFEPLWNHAYVDHVQVTAAETVGVGSRAANFYDKAGALRDMIQSHLLQVLALVAIEPPSTYDAAAIMREKIKLFQSAVIPEADEIPRAAALGRYGADPRAGDPAYADEKGVEQDRRTETFAAMRTEFDNWRWAGVPFFLRSGKKMAAKLTEVAVQFKRPPTNLFRAAAADGADRPPNRLIINIGPSEGLSLRIEGKVPGAGIKLASAKLDLDYQQAFGGEQIEAYGPLMLDAIRGDRTLFKHREEVEAGWSICQPVIESGALREAMQEYAPGSWGPPAADELIGRSAPHRAWHNPASDDPR